MAQQYHGAQFFEGCRRRQLSHETVPVPGQGHRFTEAGSQPRQALHAGQVGSSGPACADEQEELPEEARG